MSAKRAASPSSASPLEHLRRRAFDDLPKLKLPVTDEHGLTTDQEFVDYITIGTTYARRCIDGIEPCCRLIKLQARKTIEMLDAAAAGGVPYYFSPAHAVDFMTFYETLPHVDQGFYTSFIQELEPHMIWEFMHLYGFRRVGTGERLIERAYLEEPRKSVKSGRAAAVGLFDLIGSGQMVPIVVLAASTEDQTDRVFKPMRKWVDGIKDGRGEQAALVNACSSEIKAKFSLSTTLSEIRCAQNGGYIQKLAGIGATQDGWNPLCCIMEELHAQTRGMYEVLRSALRARPSGWLFMISTAGTMATGLGWDVRMEMVGILEGKREDISTFAAIYTLDEGDEKLLADDAAYSRLQEATLISLIKKCNPMWDVSVKEHKVLGFWQEALSRTDMMAEFLRTVFNLWGRSAQSVVKAESYASCANPDTSIEEFMDCDLWIGVDLASRNDMAAMGLVFDYSPKIAVFAEYWIPSMSKAWEKPQVGRLYQGWEKLRDGGGRPRLNVTDGSSTDFNKIEARIMQLYHQGFKIKGILGDDKQADQMISSLVKRGLPAGVFRKNRFTATKATDDLLTRIPGGTLIHDGNPILEWNFKNVHISRGVDDSMVPKKVDKDSDEKIDGFDAVMQANAGLMGVVVIGDAEKPDVYKDRGFLNG